MHPADTAVAEAYRELYGDLSDQVGHRLAELSPPDAEVAEVAGAIVDTSKGERPFRVTVDPAEGSEKLSDLADEVRAEVYYRLDLTDLLMVRS